MCPYYDLLTFKAHLRTSGLVKSDPFPFGASFFLAKGFSYVRFETQHSHIFTMKI